MLKALRLSIILFTSLLFWAAWYAMPGILDKGNIRWLSGVVTILWGLEFYFFQRLNLLSSIDGLTSREYDRLVWRLASIRKRVWWVGGIGFVCSFLMWLITALDLQDSSPIYATMVGILLGISLSYLILIPGWLNESQHFVDEVKRQERMSKKLAETKKILEPSK